MMPRREAMKMRWQTRLQEMRPPSRLDAYGCYVTLHEAELDGGEGIQDAHL